MWERMVGNGGEIEGMNHKKVVVYCYEVVGHGGVRVGSGDEKVVNKGERVANDGEKGEC